VGAGWSTESEKALKQGLRTKMTEVADRAETLRTFLREQEAREKEAEKKEASTLSSVCVATTRHVFHASCTIQYWPRLTTDLTFFQRICGSVRRCCRSKVYSVFIFMRGSVVLHHHSTNCPHV
jgi:hypothetical protein